MSEPQEESMPEESADSELADAPVAEPTPAEVETPEADSPKAEAAAGTSRFRMTVLLVLLVVLGGASLWYNRYAKGQQLIAARGLLDEGQNQQLSPEKRWEAIQQGIVMLRDQLIPQQPDHAQLYTELARVYQTQLSNQQDQLRMYFVFRHAVGMVTVAGSTRPIDWAMYKDVPIDPAGLADQLGPESYAALQQIANPETANFDLLEANFRQAGHLTDDLAGPLQDAGVLKALDAYLRARWLRLELKLDPAYVLELEKSTGKLDFRLPEAHAIYWARRGLDLQPEEQDALDQIILQALQQSFAEGSLIYLSPDGMPMLAPNTAVVESLNTMLKSRLQATPASHVVYASYERFLQDAVVTLFMEGDSEKAATYLTMLNELKPKTDEDTEAAPELKEFVLSTLGIQDAEITPEQKEGAIGSMLMRVYIQLALDRDRQAMTIAWLSACFQRNKGEAIPELDKVDLNSIGGEEMRWKVLAAATLNLPPPLSENLIRKLNVDREKLRKLQQMLISQAEQARRQQGLPPMTQPPDAPQTPGPPPGN